MRLWLLAIVVVVAMKSARANEELDAAFDKDVLIIEASKFACHRFDVYLAIEPKQRRRGLMFVRELPATTGMLFVGFRESMESMFMKNTLVPLDMVFVRADGTVSSIKKNAEPMSLRPIASVEPVQYVLELSAGTTDRLFIDENSRLIWEPVQGAFAKRRPKEQPQ